MSTTGRLVRLLALATLGVVLSLVPVPAEADPVPFYDGAGHYVHQHGVNGYQDSYCGPTTYCRIGVQTFEWDCVSDGQGGYTHTNFVAWTEVPRVCRRAVSVS